MARYLTPAKISLLVLIELYCFEPMPDAAILPVLMFVVSHVTDVDPTTTPGSAVARDARWDRAGKTMDLIVDVGEFEELLAPHAVVAGGTGSSTPYTTLWDLFLFRLWRISSLDCLHVFFGRLSMVMAPLAPGADGGDDHVEGDAYGGAGDDDDDEDDDYNVDDSENERPRVILSRTSPFGMFVRRAQLEFHRLRFHDMAELWRGLVRYRQPTMAYVRQRSTAAAARNKFAFDHVLVSFEHDLGGDGDLTGGLASIVYGDMLEHGADAPRLISTDDVEALLEFQIEQVQQFGNRIPVAVRDRFESILRTAHTIPSLTHYLGFVDAWRAGDYPTAFDLLRRYFDYTMQNRDRLFYQYALMNLAVLQADFGCHREALGAMLETVSTARENRDMTCLNFSLNWLFHFSCAHPQLIRELDLFEGGTGKSHIGIVNNTAGGAARASDNHSILGAGKESLAYLRVKARETDMWPLWSAVLLSEAKHSLSHGDSVASALEAMARSSHVIVEHSLTNLFGPFLGLQASLWDRLGLGWLAEQSCDLFLRLHSRSAMFDDELRVSCRLAAAAGARGDYAEAMDILKRLEGDPLRSWRPAQFCQKYRDMIDLTRALNRGGAALVTAEATLLHQTLMQNRFDDMEPDLGFAIDALHVECMMARGDLSAAFAEVDHMADVVEEEDRDVLLRARLLLLKARLYDAAGRPRRGFTVALRAAALAWRARLLHVLWEAIGLVANVLTALAEFGAAAHLLTAVLPRALETGDARLAAWLFSLLADARMGIAGAASRGSRARQEWLGSALDAVQCSLGEYAKVENVRKQAEMVAKKAMIARLGGDKRLAAECAAAHATLREAAVAA